MISLQRRCKKHRQNQVYSIRGLTLEKKFRSPILRDFGEGFYALWSFTGQQYFLIAHSLIDKNQMGLWGCGLFEIYYCDACSAELYVLVAVSFYFFY